MSDNYYDSKEKAKELIKTGASPRRYICEVHREVWDVIESNVSDEKAREKALDLLAEAYWMGKKISDRLKMLKETAQYDGHEFVGDFHERIHKRAARQNLLKNYRSVQIQTIDYCNRKCSWCPNRDLEKSPDTKMSSKTFLRVLRQLMDYGYRGDVHPFLMGEPLEDPRMLDILQKIKEYLPESKVRIITNGDNLKYAEDVKALISAGCDSIHVNHYDDDKDYKVRDKDFPQVSHFGLKAIIGTFFNRADKVGYYPQKTYEGCPHFLNKLYFRHNGDLILCCSDYHYEVVFGNVKKDSLATILQSELYQKYYYAHKNGTAKGEGLPLCKDCNLI